MKVILKQGNTKLWHWVIVALNGKTLCASEVYNSKAKAVQTFTKISAAIKDGMILKA